MVGVGVGAGLGVGHSQPHFISFLSAFLQSFDFLPLPLPLSTSHPHIFVSKPGKILDLIKRYFQVFESRRVIIWLTLLRRYQRNVSKNHIINDVAVQFLNMVLPLFMHHECFPTNFSYLLPWHFPSDRVTIAKTSKMNKILDMLHENNSNDTVLIEK